MKKLKIAAVVNCYNRFKELDLVLAAIKGQSRKLDDIVVVDDQSEENMKEVCDKHKVRYIRQEYPLKKARPGQARNKGWQDIGADLVLFVDNDIIIDENYVEIMEKIYKGAKDKNIILMAGFGGDIKIGEPVKFDRIIPHNDSKTDFSKLLDLNWDYAGSNNFMIAKALLEKHGGFDENYAGWGEEDIELFYRMTKEGVKLYINPSLRFLHIWHPINPTERRNSLYQNALYTLSKYPEMKNIRRRAWEYFRLFDNVFLPNREKPEFFIINGDK